MHHTLGGLEQQKLILSHPRGLLLLFSCSVVSDSLWPRRPQAKCTRLPCPSLSPGVFSDSCPLSWWCHPTISSSVIPFSSCLQSFPASGSFPVSQLFASGDQSIGVSPSASVLPMSIQDWLPLGWTGWISLLSKGPSRVFSNTTVQKHQFFGAQLFLWSNSHLSKLIECTTTLRVNPNVNCVLRVIMTCLWRFISFNKW